MQATSALAPGSYVLATAHAQFTLAGDLPYFRLPRDQWAPNLARLRAAHLNTVAISAPWNWHEPEEGEFDFCGEGDPQRDLRHLLSLCAEEGLRVIFRPGPHIGAGWRNGGIPDWLLDGHPEILALDALGRRPALDMCYPPITYLHPVYQSFVAGWYQAFLPLLREFLISARGPVTAVQLDDRPSYWWGLQEADPLFVDYNPWVVGDGIRLGLYQKWLAARYHDIEQLNRAYGTHHASFANVQPPRRPIGSDRELPWFSDWRRCKIDLLNQHLEYLYDWLRAGGVEVPIIISYPYQLPLAARRCADYFRLRGKPVLVAHAPDAHPLAEHRADDLNLGQVVGSAELARRWVKDTIYAPANADTPSAMSARTRADGLDVLCALQLGHGLNSLTFTPMVGGEAPPGYGLRGRVYDRGAPIGPHGELRPHYASIRRLGQFLALHGERLLRTEPLADVAFGWYEPYEDTGQLGDTRQMGWRDDYRDTLCVRFGLSCDGARAPGDLLSLMAMSGLNYSMLDLERDPLEEWLCYPQLWMAGLDFMAAPVQRDLISYVEAGGHLVMLPRVPYLDERLQPCPLLEALFPYRPLEPQPGWPTGHRRMPFNAVSLKDGRDLAVADYVDTFALQPEAEALAWEWRTCRPCAYRRPVGRGSATLLGFTLAPLAEGQLEHKRLINQLANRAGVRRHATSDALTLHVVERATLHAGPRATGFLFAVNPWAWAVRSRLTYTDPVTRASAHLPRLLKGVEFTGQGALILCLEAPIPGSDLTIAYTTSQVQDWAVSGRQVTLTLYGPAETMGETALRLPAGAPVPDVVTAGRVERQRDERGQELLIITYPHHQGSAVLRLQA
ncbi:MAG: beta-galactosidase [Anaerolineae bacterium]